MGKINHRASYATVKKVIEKTNGGTGPECDAIYVECEQSGDIVGPVWGTAQRSINRALAELSEECSCGANWHNQGNIVNNIKKG